MRVQTDWLVYRCDECHQTHYVNAAHADTWHPPCDHRLTLKTLADEHEFCDVLRETMPEGG